MTVEDKPGQQAKQRQKGKNGQDKAKEGWGEIWATLCGGGGVYPTLNGGGPPNRQNLILLRLRARQT